MRRQAERYTHVMRRVAWFSVAVVVAAGVGAAVLAGPVYASGGAGGADDDDEPRLVIGTGDFNHDGIADVVEVTSPEGDESGSHFLTVLLGQRDGTFRSVTSQSLIGMDPTALVVGDFNGDGNQDVIVGDENGAVLEFLGDGKGNMIATGSVATFGSVASMASGHFTKDGHLDLVVSDFSSNSAIVLLGTGNGSFEAAWAFSLPMQGKRFHVTTADFNHDGIADLVITNDDDDNYEVMLGNGNGTFTYAPQLSHLRDPNSYCPS
jgi:FG-GAP-like repeat